jgi:hypothetical protein
MDSELQARFGNPYRAALDTGSGLVRYGLFITARFITERFIMERTPQNEPIGSLSEEACTAAVTPDTEIAAGVSEPHPQGWGHIFHHVCS